MKIKNLLRIFLIMVVALVLTVIVGIFLTADNGHERELSQLRVVVCVPVYGQSLALGEEAVMVSKMDSADKATGGRLYSEHMDKHFGYYTNHGWKRWLRRRLHTEKRRLETSAFMMAESMAKNLGRDTAVCIVVGGAGATPIAQLDKGSEAYRLFLEDIRTACEKANRRGLEFIVPAICWMQGESDMFDYTRVNYAQLLAQWATDINRDIRQLTRQKREVKLICYQSSCLSVCWNYDALAPSCYEASIPQAQMDLVRTTPLFVAGAPTYAYDFVNQRIHLDSYSQQNVGRLHAEAALDILRGTAGNRGLYPIRHRQEGEKLYVTFNQAVTIDTTHIRPAHLWGFSVVSPQGENLAKSVETEDSTIVITCTSDPQGCRLRYGVNGDKDKTGRTAGPRGNIRANISNQPPYLYQWCFIFDEKI